jgi:hypothetical protein
MAAFHGCVFIHFGQVPLKSQSTIRISSLVHHSKIVFWGAKLAMSLQKSHFHAYVESGMKS